MSWFGRSRRATTLAPRPARWTSGLSGRSSGATACCANSFLVLASRAPTALSSDPEALAVGYTDNRVAAYTTRRTFKTDGQGGVLVLRQRATGPVPGDARLRHELQTEQFVDGTHLESEITRCVARSDWPQFTSYIEQWLAFLLREGADGSAENPLETPLRADFLDCVPRNVLVHEGRWHYIDREWVIDGDLLAGTVVLRYLDILRSDRTTNAFIIQSLGKRPPASAGAALLAHLKLRLTDAVIQNYVDVVNIINVAVLSSPLVDARSVTALFADPDAASTTPVKRIWRSGLQYGRRQAGRALGLGARVLTRLRTRVDGGDGS